MRPHRAILIDDLPPARDHLRELLEPHANIDIVGEAGDLVNAGRLVLATKPDLVFLDIQLGRDNGFDLLPLLDAARVIFVTAYDKFAVRAFEANALDYVLKPIRADRLAASLSRLEVDQTSVTPAAYALNDIITLQGEHMTRMVPLSRITMIVADRNYTKVHLADGSSVLTRKTIAKWERTLPAGLFARIDRSVFVQLATVVEVSLSQSGNARMKIDGHEGPVMVTRRGGIRLIKLLGSGRSKVARES